MLPISDPSPNLIQKGTLGSGLQCPMALGVLHIGVVMDVTLGQFFFSLKRT